MTSWAVKIVSGRRAVEDDQPPTAAGARAWTRSAAILEQAYRSGASCRPDLEGCLPIVLARGDGAYVWDIDGNRYLDLIAGRGTLPLGHRYRSVDDAAVASIRNVGTTLCTTVSGPQVRLAERLIERFPCGERAIFFRTGSCATTAAIRLARVATGRRVVLTSGYHGWHDWHLHIFPAFAQSGDREHFDFAYNLNLLEELLQRHRGSVACIVLTPEPNFYDDSYFKELEAIVRCEDVLLIFDEIVSGFRFARGGFQQYVDVVPDAVTISKGLANGYALSAVVGRTSLIEARERTHLDGTYNREVTPIAAAHATLDAYEAEDVLAHLWDVGRLLLAGLNDLFREANLRARAVRCPPDFRIVFENVEVASAFYQECLLRGVLFHPLGEAIRLTYAHRRSEVKEVLSVAREALATARSRHPLAFDGEGGSVSSDALQRTAQALFAGLLDYRAPLDQVLQTGAGNGR